MSTFPLHYFSCFSRLTALNTETVHCHLLFITDGKDGKELKLEKIVPLTMHDGNHYRSPLERKMSYVNNKHLFSSKLMFWIFV